MKPYPQRREQVFMPGLDGLFGLDSTVRQRRRTICSSEKLEWAWLRINPCIERHDNVNVPVIRSSRDVVKFLHNTVDFAGRGVEYAIALCLDIRNKPNGVMISTIGSVATAFVDPARLFQAAILSNSPLLIFAHNHPSNESSPSDSDVVITNRIKDGGKLIGVDLLDSLILTDDPTNYFSFKDSGLLR